MFNEDVIYIKLSTSVAKVNLIKHSNFMTISENNSLHDHMKAQEWRVIMSQYYMLRTCIETNWLWLNVKRFHAGHGAQLLTSHSASCSTKQ